jgi:hypothetical protein
MGVMAVEWWLKEKRLARASTGTIKLPLKEIYYKCSCI